MSASAELQKAIAALLGAPGSLRVPVPIVARRQKELTAEIEAAAAKKASLCIYVMPPLPTRAERDAPGVFFSGAEVRVRIIEQPQTNALGSDAYDLLDDVAVALHWQPRAESPEVGLAAILSYPLQLAARPVEMVEDPVTRIIDVIFEAVYGLVPADA